MNEKDIMIDVNHMSHIYTDENGNDVRALDDVNLSIKRGEFVCIIGTNGSGKSTLAKHFNVLLQPSEGHVNVCGFDTRDEAHIWDIRQHVGMVFQNPDNQIVAAVVEEDVAFGPENLGIPSDEIRKRVDAALEAVNMTEYREHGPHLLSGGQKRRLALGQALLYPCDLLLLDEPTNHLDEDSIDWLESYLSARQGGLLISTHDRYFLDSVCNGILELSNRRMYQYDGNYEEFIALKADREAREAATEEKRRQFLKREIEWVRRGALARTTKQKARLDRYEKLKNMEKTRRPDQMDPIALKTRLGKTIFDIEHLEFYFDERPMIKDFTYHVVRHDRIGIVGPNGVGKSTFMNILDGTYEPTSGTIGKGETVRIAHFKQELPEFDEDMRVLDYIREDHSYMVLGDGSTLSAGQILERFLFTPELHGVPIRKLSGGERRRLYLLKLLMSAPNVLLLDEPTNDLDIPTLEVLEDFLDSFSGVIVTVCHDRYFLDRVVDKLFVFTGDGHIEIIHGSYSDYKDALDESSGGKRPFYMTNSSTASSAKTVRTVEADDADNDDSILNQANLSNNSGDNSGIISGEVDTFKESPKKGLNKAEEAEYAKIMDELPKLEHLVKGLDVMISQVATDYEKMQALMAEREETQSQIDALTERWMELEERL